MARRAPLGHLPDGYERLTNAYRLMSGFAAGRSRRTRTCSGPGEEASVDELTQASKVAGGPARPARHLPGTPGGQLSVQTGLAGSPEESPVALKPNVVRPDGGMALL